MLLILRLCYSLTDGVEKFINDWYRMQMGTQTHFSYSKVRRMRSYLLLCVLTLALVSAKRYSVSYDERRNS